MGEGQGIGRSKGGGGLLTLGKRGMEKNGRKGGDEKLAVRISERGMVLGDRGLRQGKGVGRRVGSIKIMKGGLTREQRKA